jgi:hypothetical protein
MAEIPATPASCAQLRQWMLANVDNTSSHGSLRFARLLGSIPALCGDLNKGMSTLYCYFLREVMERDSTSGVLRNLRDPADKTAIESEVVAHRKELRSMLLKSCTVWESVEYYASKMPHVALAGGVLTGLAIAKMWSTPKNLC